MLIPKTEFVALDPGVYPATVRKVELTDGKFGPQLQLDFDIVGADPSQGGQQRAWMGTTMTEGNKTGKWVKAILGVNEVPEELNTDDLWGKPVRLSLTITTKTDGTEYNKVADVLKAAAPKARASVKPQPEPEEAEEEKVEVPF